MAMDRDQAKPGYPPALGVFPECLSIPPDSRADPGRQPGLGRGLLAQGLEVRERGPSAEFLA